MVVEIGMDIQVTAISDRMNATALEIGIGDKPFDPCHFLEEKQERAGIQRIEQRPRISGQTFGNIAGLELFLSAIKGVVRLGERLEVRDDPVQDVLWQEIVNAALGIGFLATVGFAKLPTRLTGLGAIERQCFGVHVQ